MNKKFSIIMRSCNDAAVIKDTLKMLFSQTEKNFELINMDNASTDGTQEIVKKYNQNGKIFNVPAGSYVPGRVLNEAISLAEGEILVFLNSDATPADEWWLARLTDCLEKGGHVATYSRQVARGNALLPVRVDYMRAYPPRENESKTVMFSLAAAAIYKKSLEKNKFYETGAGYSEDVEWAYRMLQKGYSIGYAPDSRVLHSHNLPLKKIYRKTHLEAIPLAKIYPETTRFDVCLRRTATGALRDLFSCRTLSDLLSLWYSPVYRAVTSLAAYQGARKGLRMYGKP